MTDALDRRSGINGLAGTSDMRVVLKNASSGDVTAQLALDVYVHRLRACIASMASAMGGLDALVFSGGVGENASAVRAATVSGLRFLDLELDATLNAKATEDSDVSAQGASCRTLVVHAREDVEVAREVRRVLSRQA
jgi:acetate kinase